MPYYLAPYIGKGTMLEPFRPLGSDQPVWSAIDLRPDGGATLEGGGLNVCFLYLPQTDTDIKLIKIGEDKFDIIGSLLKQVIVSKLNLTQLNFDRFNEIVASIMLNPPLNGWKPIRATKRGFYELHLGGIIWEQAVIKGGASDNFNRADENPLAGNWTTVPTANDCRIVTNAVKGVTTGSNEVYWNAGSFSNDQYSQLIFPTNVANNGVMCRVSTTERTFYIFQSSTSTVMRVYKSVVGTFTQLGSDYTQSLANNDTMYIEVSGSTITPKLNGTPLTSQTDTAIASGRPGFRVRSTTAVGDDWVGADLAGGGISIPTVIHHLNQMRNI